MSNNKRKVKSLKARNIDKSYANYVKRYKEKEAMLNRKGYAMASDMMQKEMYEAVRMDYINKRGRRNINQNIVAEQAYEYSLKTAKALKQGAIARNYSWKDASLLEIRTNIINIDLSQLSDLNEELKNDPKYKSGYARQSYIAYMMFGSE